MQIVEFEDGAFGVREICRGARYLDLDYYGEYEQVLWFTRNAVAGDIRIKGTREEAETAYDAITAACRIPSAEIVLR